MTLRKKVEILLIIELILSIISGILSGYATGTTVLVVVIPMLMILGYFFELLKNIIFSKVGKDFFLIILLIIGFAEALIFPTISENLTYDYRIKKELKTKYESYTIISKENKAYINKKYCRRIFNIETNNKKEKHKVGICGNQSDSYYYEDSQEDKSYIKKNIDK